MSNDLFNKDGVWQGSQNEFLEYSKDLLMMLQRIKVMVLLMQLMRIF